jgi:hypothetical protein
MKRATHLLPLVVVWVADNVTPMCPHRDKFNQPVGNDVWSLESKRYGKPTRRTRPYEACVVVATPVAARLSATAAPTCLGLGGVFKAHPQRLVADGLAI